MNTGDLRRQTPDLWGSPGVRAARVAGKSGNADGAKGGRKADASGARPDEETSPRVPAKDKQGEEELWRRYGAEHGVWSLKMLMALESGVKGNVWFSLIDKVWSDRTLGLAWEKVRSNAGSCGVDGITVERFEKDSQRRLLVVKEHLQRGDYQPKPVKRVWIPKPGTREKRPLGVPTVTDRVVQAALRMVIEPIFEKQFAPHSYGFRPGRGCKDALRQVDQLLRSGHVHVVDVDLKGYFDSIPHPGLMALVQERIADGRVLELIESFLKQGVMEQIPEVEPAGELGTPQGGVISPLLANLYLNPLDWQMARQGISMIRYADDMVMLCESAEQARQVLEQLQAWCQAAGLQLHPEKTKIVDLGCPGTHFDFLGYRFKRTNRGRLRRVIRPKSLQRIRERIRSVTRRTSGQSLPRVIQQLEPILRGIHGYFHHAYEGQLGEIDQWIRGRLRSILRKRHKGKGRGRGTDHVKWPNHYFERLGLFSLEQARRQQLISLHHGAHC